MRRNKDEIIEELEDEITELERENEDLRQEVASLQRKLKEKDFGSFGDFSSFGNDFNFGKDLWENEKKKKGFWGLGD